MNIRETVKNIIVDQLGVNMEQLADEASFVDDLGADSLDCIEMVLTAEEEFDLIISDDDAEALDTVGKAIEYIEKRVSEKR